MTIQEQLGITDQELNSIFVKNAIELSEMVESGQVSNTAAKEIFNEMWQKHLGSRHALQLEVQGGNSR